MSQRPLQPGVLGHASFARFDGAPVARLRLDRWWDATLTLASGRPADDRYRPLVVIGINPSDAGGDEDDNTSAKWASKDETRPHIQMVYFGAKEYVATDGHRMVVVPYTAQPDGEEHEEYQGAPFGVLAKHLTAAIQAQGALNGATHSRIVLDAQIAPVKIWLDTNSVSVLVPAQDAATYPPYQKVIPTEPDKGEVSPDGYTIDPRYLAAIAEVNEATCPPGYQGVRVTAWSRDRLGAIAFTNINRVRFCVMPMRQ